MRKIETVEGKFPVNVYWNAELREFSARYQGNPQGSPEEAFEDAGQTRQEKAEALEAIRGTAQQMSKFHPLEGA